MNLKNRTSLQLECLEAREVLTAKPLPVLMVLADQRDFYYSQPLDISLTTQTQQQQQKELHYTGGRFALDLGGSSVGSVGFVGGWGASMYQYS